MNNVVERLVSWIHKNASPLQFNLNDPADAKSIDDIQNTIGEELPELLLQLYLKCNGQAWEAKNGIFYDLHFVSFESILEQIAVGSIPSNEELVTDEVWENDIVKPYIYYPKWIPFAQDCSGELLSLDFDPGINGKKAQVIRHGEFDATVVANSFEEYLVWYVGQLEAGKYYIGEPLEGIYDEPTTVFCLENGVHYFENPIMANI